MPGQRFSPFGRGEKLRANDLNKLGVEQARQGKITGDGKIVVTDGPHGVTLALRDDEMMAIITGDGPPYVVTEAQVEPDGMFYPMVNGRVGQGYEINGFPVYENSVVRCWPGVADNEWHFAFFGTPSDSTTSGGSSSIDCSTGFCRYSNSSGRWVMYYTTCASTGCLCGAPPVCPPSSGCATVEVPCTNPDDGVPPYSSACTGPSSGGGGSDSWPGVGWCIWNGSSYQISSGATPPSGVSVFGACESSISSCCCSDDSGCLGECDGACWYRNGSLFSNDCESACGCHSTAPIPSGMGACDIYSSLCRRIPGSGSSHGSDSQGSGSLGSNSMSSSSPIGSPLCYWCINYTDSPQTYIGNCATTYGTSWTGSGVPVGGPECVSTAADGEAWCSSYCHAPSSTVSSSSSFGSSSSHGTSSSSGIGSSASSGGSSVSSGTSSGSGPSHFSGGSSMIGIDSVSSSSGCAAGYVCLQYGGGCVYDDGTGGYCGQPRFFSFGECMAETVCGSSSSTPGVSSIGGGGVSSVGGLGVAAGAEQPSSVWVPEDQVAADAQQTTPQSTTQQLRPTQPRAGGCGCGQKNRPTR